jgi:hypothetical protein
LEGDEPQRHHEPAQFRGGGELQRVERRSTRSRNWPSGRARARFARAAGRRGTLGLPYRRGSLVARPDAPDGQPSSRRFRLADIRWSASWLLLVKTSTGSCRGCGMPGRCGSKGRARHAVGARVRRGRAELGADYGFAPGQLRLGCLRATFRGSSSAARSASPRSRRKSTSRSPSCGRCSCARQQSRYRRASSPVRGTPM